MTRCLYQLSEEVKMGGNPIYYDRFETGEIGFDKLRNWWFHLKLYWFGNKKFEKHGGGIIPCKDCGQPFQSWLHFDYYDEYCEFCSFKRRDPIVTKFEIESLLNEYDRRQISWTDTKACLVSSGIKVGGNKNER